MRQTETWNSSKRSNLTAVVFPWIMTTRLHQMNRQIQSSRISSMLWILPLPIYSTNWKGHEMVNFDYYHIAWFSAPHGSEWLLYQASPVVSAWGGILYEVGFRVWARGCVLQPTSARLSQRGWILFEAEELRSCEDLSAKGKECHGQGWELCWKSKVCPRTCPGLYEKSRVCAEKSKIISPKGLLIEEQWDHCGLGSIIHWCER